MTTTWLDPVRLALDEAAEPVAVFFRDDDAGWEDEALLRLLDVFADAGLPIDLAAIPAAVDAPLAATLIERAATGVHVHQHGSTHTNHEPVGRSCEFGASRSVAERRADVMTGRARLLDLFGDRLEPVFTPPWNRCEPDVADHLAEAGVRVLSRDHTAPVIGHAYVCEVPVNVDWFGRTKGQRWSRDELGLRLAERVRAGTPVGVMLHHAVTDADELAAIGALVGLVAMHEQAVCTSILAVAVGAP